ncbi:LysR family transcriptional regulator [Mesorhizobium loti]|uniref:HTH-type transcriptional regulator CbbR n=1 Tax=Mesorhizobium loti R88b TaxID=935548 RepID=A0A6M7WYM6_RHILI|nr:LysR family transcriptional regulator [Mesorhizobium loti]QKD05264.1 LysR family transcriptional regulator [Mesorhizobium loti R88b]
MRNISLRQLRSVTAIHRHGKIVSAAAELGLTPPAVTLQLQQLEHETGLVLFDRTPDGMRATTAGLAVLDTAQAIEERLRVLSDEIDAVKGVKRGSLRLGVVSTAKYFAPRLMAAFMANFPGIEMKLAVGNRAETIESLKNHSLDIALMGRPPPGIPVRAVVFGDHPLVIIAAPDHPLVRQRDITRERIAGESFLMRESGSGTRISMEIFMRGVAGWMDNPGIEMDSNETIKQSVMAGLGVAFISGHTVAYEVETRRLALLDVIGMPLRRQWFAVARSDRAMTPAMGAFHDFLAKSGARYLPAFGQLYPEPTF